MQKGRSVGFRRGQLSYVENEMLQDVVNEHEDKRRVQRVPTACSRFYDGCECPGCELAEEHSPFSWPKVKKLAYQE